MTRFASRPKGSDCGRRAEATEPGEDRLLPLSTNRFNTAESRSRSARYKLLSSLLPSS